MTNNGAIAILRTLLRPAVRFALRRGIRVRAIAEELKSLLLEEAQQELARAKQEPTLSKLSVMTGLQRRDVHRLSSPIAEPTQHLDLLTRVIGTWTTSDRFSRGAKPHLLSFEGAASDFAELVRDISTDVNPTTILFELERLGLVERRGQELQLLRNAYQITGDIDDAYLLLERDLRALVEGVDRNITGDSPIPNLHISTHFDNITVCEVAALKEWLLKKGAALHAEAREYLGALDKDITPSRYSDAGGVKVTLTSFSLCELPEGANASN